MTIEPTARVSKVHARLSDIELPTTYYASKDSADSKAFQEACKLVANLFWRTQHLQAPRVFVPRTHHQDLHRRTASGSVNSAPNPFKPRTLPPAKTSHTRVGYGMSRKRVTWPSTKGRSGCTKGCSGTTKNGPGSSKPGWEKGWNCSNSPPPATTA